MTITVTKSKSAAKTSAAPKTQTQLQVEEFIQLYSLLLEQGAFENLKNYEKIKKTLQSIAIESGTDPAQPYVFTTPKGDVIFAPCADKTIITDKAKMIKMLGDKLFAELGQVGITDLRKYLGEVELAKITEVVPGSRALASVNPAE